MRVNILALAGLLFASRGLAQDPFEIHIYEYEPLSWREYSFKAHLNFDPQGSSLRGGSLLATHNQTHLTLEPTIGLSENFALGFMFLNAWEPGYSPQFAGWRVLPHIYAPESWGLPFKLALIGEFSFQKSLFEEIHAGWSCVPLSITNSHGGKPSSIQCSSGRCMGRERGAAGILSQSCCCA